jgi:Fe2+ or Zn2+ uptake regulation protein
MLNNVVDLLRSRGINPSAQRVAVAEYVLFTDEHPSADQVWERVRAGFPMLSRATVYNTLNAFVAKGLLRELILAEGKVVFDPHMADHHHLIDSTSGTIYDIPWEAVQVTGLESLKDVQVERYQIVAHGTRKS